MSTPIIMRECNAAEHIDAGQPVTITAESGGVYTVRPASGEADPVDGTAASTAAANDMVTVATPPSFGQRLSG
jgi:predicted transcriptional regulator